MSRHLVKRSDGVWVNVSVPRRSDERVLDALAVAVRLGDERGAAICKQALTSDDEMAMAMALALADGWAVSC